MEIEATLRNRRSVRAFRPDPVEYADVAKVLELARTAPSGANLQPGVFHVLTGAPLHTLSESLINAIDAGQPQVSEYSYFPNPMPAHLKSRQREAGFALYHALGIERRDLEGRRAQFKKNYRFFDAPVGIVVTIERSMGKGCFMDLGMALQNLFLAVEAQGLAACGIGALANYADVVHAHLELPEQELVVCGIALGHPDPDAPENLFRTSRLPLGDFATFRGF